MFKMLKDEKTARAVGILITLAGLVSVSCIPDCLVMARVEAATHGSR